MKMKEIGLGGMRSSRFARSANDYFKIKGTDTDIEAVSLSKIIIQSLGMKKDEQILYPI